TVHAKSDPRIDSHRLWARLGRYPTDPAEQNQVWFKLYLKHQNEAAVLEANQRYLLFRDLASASILMLAAIGALAALGWLQGLNVGNAALGLVFQYFVTALAARERGNRLVTNVLAASAATD